MYLLHRLKNEFLKTSVDLETALAVGTHLAVQKHKQYYSPFPEVSTGAGVLNTPNSRSL
jgi:hypothetical protein